MKIYSLFPICNSVSIMLSVIALVVVGSFQPAYSADSYYQFNDKGELVRPTGYRERVFVGTPLTPNDMNDGRAPFPEFHAVYIDLDSWAHWKKTGKFREGTILMKELISVGSKSASSGKGYFMGEFLGLEATIKSSKRFPDELGVESHRLAGWRGIRQGRPRSRWQDCGTPHLPLTRSYASGAAVVDLG